MKKNVAGQVIGAHLISKTDGSNVTTGTTTVYVTGDNGTQASGSGTVDHKGNGFWTYAPTQAETNYNHVAFTFVNSSAVSVTVQVYTNYPQSGDSYPTVNTNLDTTISSRAPAATALSNATWTDTKAGYLDAAISSRSTLTAADVWGYTTRTLSSFGTLVSDIWDYSTRTLTDFSTSLAVAIWNVLESAISVANSIGLKVKTNLDATVSSRALESDGNIAAIKTKTDQLTFTVTNKVDANVTHVAGTSQTARDLGSDTQNILDEVSSPDGQVVSDAGNTATSFKTNLTQTADNYWKDAYLKFKTGNLANQVKKITGYNGTTKFITVASAFTETPASGDTFDIINR